MTIVTINYADQDVEVIAGADAWTTSISTNRRFNGQRYNATRANQDEIRWNRYFPKSGTYRVKVVHLTDAASGITKLGINGVNGTKNTTNILNDDDWYSGSGIKNVESFATVEVARGFNYINHLTNSKNGSSSNYYIYYEFVEFTLINEHPVLGEATASPRNGMELLASVDWSSGGTIDTGTFTAKKYLWVQMSYQNTTSGFIYFNFNTDNTGANYSSRYSSNGATDVVNTTYGNNESFYNLAGVGSSSIYSNGFINMFIMNNSADEKLVISDAVQIESTELGSGYSPTTRREGAGKWINTSSQVTQIQLKKGSNNFSGGTIKVWGHD